MFIGKSSLAVVLFTAALALAQPGRARFRHIIVDSSNSRPIDPWGKAVGDLNGDKRPDLTAGGRKTGGLAWYENSGDMSSWQRRSIAAGAGFSTDHEVADVDGDGDNDIVSIRDGLLWYENARGDGSEWTAHPVSPETLHDVEVADLNGDGMPDLAARNQGEWGDGTVVFIHRQEPRGKFTAAAKLPVLDGEGLLVTDLSGDGRPDIVVNGRWYENRNRAGEAGQWHEHVYGNDVWPNTFLAAGDINGDGRTDLVVAPSERDHDFHKRISWFEAPAEGSAPWREHTILSDTQAVHHFVGVADFDGDGELDVATAEMRQGDDPDLVAVFRNHGKGGSWERVDIADTGSHSMRIADLNGDGAPDLFGANWNTEADPRGAPVEIWLNEWHKAVR